jgi:hypothetical protein
MRGRVGSKGQKSGGSGGNPLDGSRGMLQIQPTNNSELRLKNPTDGSRGMLQIQPTNNSELRLKNPTDGSLSDRSSPTYNSAFR